MKIILIAIGIFFLFRYLQAKYQLGQIKEKFLFNLKQVNQLIEKDPGNALYYCRRGSINMKMQNLVKARDDFRYALTLIDNGFPAANREMLVSNILLNIKFTEKPLPWSGKGPKDYSKSAMFYFLVDRFGDLRYHF